MYSILSYRKWKNDYTHVRRKPHGKSLLRNLWNIRNHKSRTPKPEIPLKNDAKCWSDLPLAGTLKETEFNLQKEKDGKAKVEKEKRKVEGDLKETRDKLGQTEEDLAAAKDLVVKKDKSIRELEDAQEGMQYTFPFIYSQAFCFTSNIFIRNTSLKWPLKFA